jgi:hypothetical protein
MPNAFIYGYHLYIKGLRTNFTITCHTEKEETYRDKDMREDWVLISHTPFSHMEKQPRARP